VGFFFTVVEGLALDEAGVTATVLTLSEISDAGMLAGEGDFFLATGASSDLAAAGTASDLGRAVRADAFLTGFFSARATEAVLTGTADFFGVTMVLPVKIFEARMDDVFFAEMGDGLTFITKKSLL
jgi:hypothetical protein